eukprot:12275289-Heterocapsa_arctica.AAC.1
MGPTRTSDMVVTALTNAESRGAIPALICGDLHKLLGQLDVVTLLVASGWPDLGARAPAGTCEVTRAGESRRIGVMLANSAFLARTGRICMNKATR